MGGKTYSMSKSKADDDAAASYAATQARLGQIQKHFAVVQNGGRLKGKVCILTGVGSPKGIGRASAVLFAREGPSCARRLRSQG
jgi:hypothetical protein